MLRASRALVLAALLMMSPHVVRAAEPAPPQWPQPWRGLHVIVFRNDKDLEILGSQIPKLANMGLNTLILEVNYNFAFKSHPELRSGQSVITATGARQLAAVCRKHRIHLIPQFQC